MTQQAVKVLFKYELGTRPAANVLYFTYDDGDITTNEVFATQITNNWADEMVADATAGACVFTGTTMTDVLETFQVETAENKAGTGTGQMAGPAATYLLRYSLVGTTQKGRSYLPGVGEDTIDAYGTVSSGTSNYIDDGYDTFISKMVANVPSFTHVVKTKGDVFRVVASSNCDSKIATQRRRLRK